MKKTLLPMFAMAAMLFATSCSQEEDFAIVADGTEVAVSFSLTQPEISTRAYSDGETAKTLTYAVYEANSTVALISSEEEGRQKVTFENKTANLTLNLVKGKSYDILFWADAVNAPYTFDAAAQTITVNYEDALSNDENRDAFFATVKGLKIEGASQKSVELKRPFAQLNLGATDTEAAADVDFVAAKTQVKVKCYSTLDLFSGDVVDKATERTFALAAIPGEGETFPATGVTAQYLAMNYLLVNAKEIVDVEFTVSNGSHAFTNTYSNVPVQRNHRTNIYGSLLTNATDFTITIDPIYGGQTDMDEDESEVTTYSVRLGDQLYQTIEEALAVAKDDDVIYLGQGSFNLPAKLYVGVTSTDPDITFVGTGDKTVVHALTPTQNDRPSTYADNHGITFKNLKYETHNSWLRAGFAHARYVNFEECTIIGGYHCFAPTETFKDCTFDPMDDFIVTYGSLNTTFEGCTFNSSKGNAIQAYSEGFDNDLYLTIKDCEFTATQAGKDQWYNGPITAIEISSIRGNNFIVDITNTTATGYSTGNVSGNCLWNWRDNSADSNSKGTESAYVTVDGSLVFPPITLNGTAYATLGEALAAAVDNDVITIASGTYEIPAGGQNKTLKFVGSDAANVTFKLRPNGDAHHDGAFRGSKITFENLTIEANPNLSQYSGYGHCEGTYKNCIIKNVYTLYGTSLFEKCKFEVTGDKYNVWTWGANATFTECTFNCDGKAVLVYQDVINHESTLNFKECTFNDSEALVNETKAAIETGADNSTTKYTLNIENCTVNGFAQTSQKSNLGGTELGSTLWGNKNLMTAENLDVIIDGNEVY